MMDIDARILQACLCVYLMFPPTAWAQAIRDPLNYPLRQWMFILGLALFGGLASWWGKVRKGEVAYYNITALVGELTISAFAGVITFLGCEYANLGPFLTPALTGIAGHMGGRAIAMIERFGERRLARVLSAGSSAADKDQP